MKRPGGWEFAVLRLLGSVLAGGGLIFLFAVSPAWAENHDGTIHISVLFEEPALTVEDGLTRVQLAGASTFGLPGMPMLPYKCVEVVIPCGRKVASVCVTPGPSRSLPGAHTIEWGQKPHRMDRPAPAERTDPDPEVYASTAAYPSKAASYEQAYGYRGYAVLPITVCPLQYVPATGEVSCFESMELTIYTAPVDPAALKGEDYRKNFRSELVRDRAQVLKRVANPESTYSYPLTSGSTEGSGGSSGGSSGGLASFVDPADSYQYVIITSTALKNEFSALKSHKLARGLTATIVVVSDIYGSYSGRDSQEQLRNFIIDAYNNWETEYILLGGDDDIIPYRGVYGYCGGYTDNGIPCDMYYGCLDGDWDNDGDGIFGEGSGQGSAGEEADFYAEVFVGRATVETATETQHWVDKVIWHESNSQDPHMQEVVLIGEFLWSSPSNTWGGDSQDVVAQAFPQGYNFTRLYERDGTFSGSAVVQNLNASPAIVSHLGHANYNIVFGIGLSSIDGLTNTKPFFAYSQGCIAGGFDQGTSGFGEAISEHMVFNSTGAYAVVMNSRYGWGSPGNAAGGPSHYFNEEFFDAVFNEGLKELGKANQDSKQDNLSMVGSTGAMRWCYMELNLLGCPETQLSPDPFAGRGDELLLGLGSGSEGYLEVFSDSGSGYAHLAWPRVPWGGYNQNCGESRPSTGNFDMDGREEYVVGLGSGGGGWMAIHDDALSGYALLEWVRIPWGGYNNQVGESYPACGDVDGDGMDEIVVGLAAYPQNGGWLCILDKASATDYGVSQVSSAWINTGGGTELSLGDDATAMVALGFDFEFFGNTHANAYVCSNGFLQFSGPYAAYSNASIPASSPPNDFVAPFWDDLNPATGGSIRYLGSGSAPNRVMTVEWNQVPHYGLTASQAVTFQVSLYEGTNQLIVRYQDVTFDYASYDSGLGATVGVEDASGANGTQYSYNTASLSAGMALAFTPPSQGWEAVWRRVNWSAYNAQSGETRPACGDLDGDGRDEIVVGLGSHPACGGWLYRLEDAASGYQADGWVRLPWGGYNSVNGEVWPVCGELDGDGRDELAVGLGAGGDGYVWLAEDAAAGYASLTWIRTGWNAYDTAHGETRPAIGNLDSDSEAEIRPGSNLGV